ncbi:MAG: cytochrome c oxidase subunit II [Cyanobacteria bacterium J06621_15]
MNLRKIILIIFSATLLAVASLGIGQLSYSWLPPQATAESLLIDDLFSFLVTLGAFIFLGVCGAIVYSILFNRAGKYDFSDGPHIEGNLTVEVVWTAIPFVLVIWIAAYSYQIYDQMSIIGSMEHHKSMSMGMESAIAEPLSDSSTTSENPEKIQVISKQWAWIFNYPEQNISSTELHLPVNQRAHLTLESEDVIHGFYIPAFRVKQDVIPNETINFEFTPILEGKYRLRDSQYSGTYFAAMQTDVVVESPEKYQQWLKEAQKRKPSPAYNQAIVEYHRKSDQAIDTNWATVKPAEPPVVNYHN